MIVYDEILVPTDGSDAALTAVDQGITIATRFDANLHFLYVVNIETEMGAAAVGEIAGELTESLEEMAVRALDEAESRTEGIDVSVERHIVEGVPSESIVNFGARNDVDLIVIGATGNARLTEEILGSTTDRVAQSANASVLIAR
ncbi:MAG: universal stress protein [Halobacteriaceae archaeon]